MDAGHPLEDMYPCVSIDKDTPTWSFIGGCVCCGIIEMELIAEETMITTTTTIYSTFCVTIAYLEIRTKTKTFFLLVARFQSEIRDTGNKKVIRSGNNQLPLEFLTKG
ncbi:hypothetical protein CDAR_24571, partial [Caerostris darwini]